LAVAPIADGVDAVERVREASCTRPRLPVGTRLQVATQPLLGAPYVRSPLGEGRPPDSDPVLRFDAFDCTTFVETALALVDCDAGPVASVLQTIRYRSPDPRFASRRHLMASQWVPDLVASGRLRDVTAELHREQARRLEYVLSPRRWEGRRIAKDLELPSTAIPFGTHRVWYVPTDALDPQRLPVGTIINVVRVNWVGAPDPITHQGLVVDHRGTRFIRHASTVSRRVVDESTARFFGRLEQPRGWPVLGVQLLAPTDHR
jgi:hypothetical protein